MYKKTPCSFTDLERGQGRKREREEKLRKGESFYKIDIMHIYILNQWFSIGCNVIIPYKSLVNDVWRHFLFSQLERHLKRRGSGVPQFLDLKKKKKNALSGSRCQYYTMEVKNPVLNEEVALATQSTFQFGLKLCMLLVIYCVHLQRHVQGMQELGYFPSA